MAQQHPTPISTTPFPVWRRPALHQATDWGRYAAIVALYLVGWFLVAMTVIVFPMEHLSNWKRNGEHVDAYFVGKCIFTVLALINGLVMAWCFMRMIAEYVRRRRVNFNRPDETLPFVSILVPAYNESETMAAALEGLLSQDYPSFEVIVIDDGSKDNTYEIAKRFEGTHGNATYRVYRKPNGGKWTALNFGFWQTRGEFILCLDADSRINADALRLMVAQIMMADDIAAVCGNVRVRNPDTLLIQCQAIEYVMSNTISRIPQSADGAILVVPGPIGLYRKSALMRVYEEFGKYTHCEGEGQIAGPYEHTFAEDFDLSLTVLAQGGRIVYEPFAVSNTKSPTDIATLLNQRYRWRRGSLQVMRKYMARFWKYPGFRDSRLIFWFGILYIYEWAVFPLVFVLFWTMLSTDLLAGDGQSLMWFNFVVFFAQIFQAYLLGAVIHREPLRIAPAAFLIPLYSGLLLPFIFIASTIDEFRNKPMKW